MPNIDQMFPSKYLKKDDFPSPQLLTIKSLIQDGLDDKAQPKWIMAFYEKNKPLWLNFTNSDLIGIQLNNRDSDNWIGQKITLWNDPSVSSPNGTRGGIRVLIAPPSPPTVQPSTDPNAPLQGQPQGVYHVDDKGY